MIPRLICSSCGHELSPNDKFCASCGEKVTPEGQEGQAHALPALTCHLCGSENAKGSVYCSVCGAALGTPVGRTEGHAKSPEEKKAEQRPEKRSGHADDQSKRRQRRGLEGWKVIAVVGGVLVLGLVLIVVTRNQAVRVPATTQPAATVSPTLMREIEDLRKIVEANPTNAGALLKLANLLHDGRFFDQAIVQYKKYLAVNEKDPDARVDLGICYFELGDREKAIEEMEKALKFSPRHQLGHFNLGIVNLGSGDLEKAISWFKKSIEIAPETETARRAQELINQHAVRNGLKLN